MNFVADESVDRQIVERLRHDGHEVWAVAEMDPSVMDEQVLELANKRSAPLITADKDFGELVFRQNMLSHGVVLIRLSGLLAESKANLVSAVIGRYLSETFQNFTVITPNGVRIRKIR